MEIGMKRIKLMKSGEWIVMSVGSDMRAVRFFLTEDEAQHLSNRLQSFAKGNYGSEVVHEVKP